MDDLLIRSILDLQNRAVKAVLATIVRTEGSTPREPGTRMLIMENEQTIGTIGGGSAEKKVIERALFLLRENQDIPTEICRLATRQVFAPEEFPACGGSLEVMLEAVQEPEFWRFAWILLTEGKEAVLITSLFPPYAKSVWDAQGNVIWGRPQSGLPVTAPKLQQLSLHRQALVWGTNELSWLVETLNKRERLLVLGAGHVGREVVYYAKPLDFHVTVLDDRESFIRPELFPGAQVIECQDFVEGIKAYLPDRDTYVVIATWSHETDGRCLKETLNYPAKYIGLLGSKKKIVNILINLQGEGYTPENLSRLHGPIGLDIGAQTPEEIALSILAEIIYVRRKAENVN